MDPKLELLPKGERHPSEHVANRFVPPAAKNHNPEPKAWSGLDGAWDPCGEPEPPTPAKLTGGSVAYYRVYVADPTTPGVDPYTAECNDLIESLGLTYAEANILKAIWRIAKDRMGEGKPGTTSEYDGEKVVFFAPRVLKAIQRKALPKPQSNHMER